MPDVKAALAALRAARPDYDLARKMYDGQVDEVLLNARLRRLFADSGRSFKINYARTPVDVMVERTVVQGITASTPSAQTVLDQNWADNELGIEAKDGHRRAYEFGDAFLIAWPDTTDDGTPTGTVTAYMHDPTEVRVFYDPQSPRRKSHAVHHWLEVGTEDNGLKAGTWDRVDLYYPDRVECWVSTDPAVDSTGRKRSIPDDKVEWREYDDGQGWPLDNPTPDVIPVFHFRTLRPYGRPEHADAYGPQNMITKLAVSLMGAVDRQVLPQRYALLEGTRDTAPPPAAQLFEDDNPLDPERQTGPTRDDLGDQPGDTWLLEGVKSAGQFDPASLDGFLSAMGALVEHMADVCDLPSDRFRRSGQQASAASKRADEAPLRAKVADRQAQFGVVWREYLAYVLLVAGVDGEAEVAWAPPETYNDTESWQAALLQLDAGVPFAQVMRERGYQTDVVQKWEADLPGGVPPAQAEPGGAVSVGVPAVE